MDPEAEYLTQQMDPVKGGRSDGSLRLALVRLAKQYGRCGYRKIAELLRIEGWHINHKKVERLWRGGSSDTAASQEDAQMRRYLRHRVAPIDDLRRRVPFEVIA